MADLLNVPVPGAANVRLLVSREGQSLEELEEVLQGEAPNLSWR
jgi:hypothetical protein